MKKLFLFNIVLLTATYNLIGYSYAGEKTMPFKSGERLIYQVKWRGIKAGTAMTDVYPIKTFEGKDSYHFVLTAKTSSFFDKVYKCRATIDSFSDINMTRSTYLKETDTLGKNGNELIVHFDWNKKKAQIFKNRIMEKSICIFPGTFDIFSFLYFLRTFDIKRKTEFESIVTDGTNLIVGKIDVVKRKEIIKLKNHVYETNRLRLKPKKINGEIYKKRKRDEIHVWMTNDKRQIPVKIKSKLLIGTLSIELVKIENRYLLLSESGTDKGQLH